MCNLLAILFFICQFYGQKLLFDLLLVIFQLAGSRQFFLVYHLLHLLHLQRLINFIGKLGKDGLVGRDHFIGLHLLGHVPRQQWIVVLIDWHAFHEERGCALAHDLPEFLQSHDHPPVLHDLVEIFDLHEVRLHQGRQNHLGVLAPLLYVDDAGLYGHLHSSVKNGQPEFSTLPTEDLR